MVNRRDKVLGDLRVPEEVVGQLRPAQAAKAAGPSA